MRSVKTGMIPRIWPKNPWKSPQNVRNCGKAWYLYLTGPIVGIKLAV